MKDKRINGCALELIMRDVLDGICEFTHETCSASQTDAMDILGIHRATKAQRPTACIIPFPLVPQASRKA
jgi:DNA-binding protein Fis